MNTDTALPAPLPLIATEGLPHPEHKLAGLFPLIDGPHYEALVEDIRANGLREPIVLLEGAVLDGRNRYRACIAAKVEPVFRDWAKSDGDPLAYVISKNLHRRHLNESQRAIVAAKLAARPKGRPPKNQQICGSGISQARAAALLNVSTRSVESARQIIDRGEPELVDQVAGGRARLHAAVKRLDAPGVSQRGAAPQIMSRLRMITSPCSITAYIDERADDHLRHANGDLEQAAGTFLYEILRSPKLVQGLFGHDALLEATKKYLETRVADATALAEREVLT